MARQRTPGNNWLPTPLVEGTAYRLLGAVVFTIADVTPGYLELYVQNFITRAVRVSVNYVDGSTHASGMTVIGTRGEGWLRVFPPDDFTGTFQIFAAPAYS